MAVNYTITGQSQRTDINPSGTGFHEVWDVRFRVTDGPARGTDGTLSFPESEHTADMVKRAIEAKVAQLNAIASLGQ